MADEYAPGRSEFWIYFVVSVPFCAAIVYGSYLVNLPNFGWFNKIHSRLEEKKTAEHCVSQVDIIPT
ncbi:hypothetical protein N7465_011785 [Penicillium sp. CMV-2018d]|nr:hypothetical protein N7465_011785 [Penicillium sp. CMV-2018d]